MKTTREHLLDMHSRYRGWRESISGDSPDEVGHRCGLTNVINDIAREIAAIDKQEKPSGD